MGYISPSFIAIEPEGALESIVPASTTSAVSETMLIAPSASGLSVNETVIVSPTADLIRVFTNVSLALTAIVPRNDPVSLPVSVNLNVVPVESVVDLTFTLATFA